MPEIREMLAGRDKYTRGRNGLSVSEVVLHVADGSEEGTIQWFRDAASRVSAHYVISDAGRVTRCVPETDTAWHAGNLVVNRRSIGIEHEGRPSRGPWTPTRAQLLASVELVADICRRYNITPDAASITPHSKYNPRHNCPGPTWPWAEYLAAVKETLTPTRNAHQPDPYDSEQLRLFDPRTNKQIGRATLIVGTDKAYVHPEPKDNT